MNFRIVEREGISEAIAESAQVFFSGDRAEAERHFQTHPHGDSTTLLAFLGEELVGILTIRWQSQYPPFRERNIPLIHYIEVKWERRGQGIGNALMAEAERFASARVDRLGICVGLFDAYGPAQRLYVKRGFVPDGRGACQGAEPLREGQIVAIDHELLIWLVKCLAV